MRIAGLALIVCLGCATPTPAPKVAFSTLMTSPRAGAVDDALTEFQRSAKDARATSADGAPMPAAHARAWVTLLDASEAFLDTAADDAWVTRAAPLRLKLETELQADASKFGDVPDEVAGRVPRLLQQLSRALAARAPQPVVADPRRFRWPVQPLVLTSPYGTRVHPIAGEPRFHAGVDLEAPRRHRVYAASDGTVSFAGWNGAHGRQIELLHDPHWATRYSHLDRLLVEAGARVKKGDVIGLVGETGLATGPHVHFELRRDGDALDPELFLPQAAAPLISERP